MKYSIKRDGQGFGAIYQSYMSGIAYCSYKGYEYIHKEIESLDSVHCNTPYGENKEKLNKFIGIPHNISVPDKTEKFSSDVHWSDDPDKYYTKNVLNIVKSYYYSTYKPKLSRFEIAIHIRRGDVSPKSFERYTGNDKYKEIINVLKQKYPKYKICIYSEGKLEDFKELYLDNVYFCLNKSITLTFHNLVKAKVLVTAKSSFSYCAALLSDEEVYYIPFSHKPLKHWNVI